MGDRATYAEYLVEKGDPYLFGSRKGMFGCPVDFEVSPQDILEVRVFQRTLQD